VQPLSVFTLACSQEHAQIHIHKHTYTLLLTCRHSRTHSHTRAHPPAVKRGCAQSLAVWLLHGGRAYLAGGGWRSHLGLHLLDLGLLHVLHHVVRLQHLAVGLVRALHAA